MEFVAHALGVGRFGLLVASDAARIVWSGNLDYYYDCYLSFFQDVAKLDIDWASYANWRTLAECSGPRIVHADFCMISDRPYCLKFDDQNRPHCDDGPFMAWRDGTALYAIHGVRVPWDIVENPACITKERILAEENAEVKRVMIERMGAARWIEVMGLKPHSSDEWGTLFRSSEATYVKVANSTANADGTFDDYYLSVNRELRPMRRNPSTGQIEYRRPQKLTALNAVASTFFMTGEEYKAVVLQS